MIHDNYDLEFVQKTHDINVDFQEFIAKAKTLPNYIYVYGCNSHDTKYTLDELKSIKNEISKYINIDNFFVIGSKSDPNLIKGEKWNKRPVRTAHDHANDLMKEVFGDHYIELYPSNVFCLCAETLGEYIKKIIHLC